MAVFLCLLIRSTRLILGRTTIGFALLWAQAVVSDVFVHRGGAVFLWELKETVSSVISVERIEFSSS